MDQKVTSKKHNRLFFKKETKLQLAAKSQQNSPWLHFGWFVYIRVTFVEEHNVFSHALLLDAPARVRQRRHFVQCPEEYRHYCVKGQCRYVAAQETPACMYVEVPKYKKRGKGGNGHLPRSQCLQDSASGHAWLAPYLLLESVLPRTLFFSSGVYSRVSNVLESLAY